MKLYVLLAGLIFSLAASAALAGAPASSAEPAPAPAKAKTCFEASQLTSWREAGDRTVNLRVGVNDVYQLKLLNSCPDLPFAEAIGIETTRGNHWICSGLDVNLIVPGTVTHTIPQRCMATSLHRLSPEEAKALPPKEKP
jgi:hypothetical protein